MNHLDLFSGIGGFALAARWAGMRTVGFVEIDAYCRRVLRKHWPDVHQFGDIHDVTGNDIREYCGHVGIITGGFPCQPYSVAGKRRGNEDNRAIWPQMCRVIAEVRPRWVVGENVAGVINLALDGVLTDLEAEGYEAWTVVFPACAVGAWHIRQRVFIVAHCDSDEYKSGSHANGRTTGAELSAANTDSYRFGHGTNQPQRECRCSREAIACNDGTSAIIPDAAQQPKREQADKANAVSVARRAWNESSDSSSHVADADCTRSQRRVECGERAGEWLTWSGSEPYADIWRVEPAVGRVAHGVSRRVDRLRGLGNAVVPQQVYPILAGIAQMEAAG